MLRSGLKIEGNGEPAEGPIAVNRPVDVVMAISEQKYLGSRIGLAHAGGYWTLVLCHGERQSMN